MSIKEELKYSLIENGSRSCVVIGDSDYSYTDVAQIINSLNQSLKDYTVIAFESTKDIYSYACILYCILNDKVFVPVSSDQPVERVCYILNGSRAEIFFTDTTPEGYQGNVISKSSVHTHLDDATESDVITSSNGHNDLSYILYTSGSTGHPKGVKIGRQSLSTFINNIQKDIDIKPDDRISQFYELIFDVSIQDIMLSVLSGATLVVCTDSDKLFPHRFIADKRITVWSSVPSALTALIDRLYRSSVSLPELRISIFAGEALSPEFVRKWAKICTSSQIFNLYGPTETTIGICWTELTEENIKNGDVSIGVPPQDHKYHLEDDSGNPSQSKGELIIEGSQVAIGYTSGDMKGFHSGGSARSYRTGDIVEFRNNKLYYLGRKDSQLKVRGYRIDLRDVEENLRKLCNFSDIHVVSPELRRVRILVAVSESQSVIDTLRATDSPLPGYMKPDKYIAIDNIPKTLSGKTDKKKLTRLIEKKINGESNERY